MKIVAVTPSNNFQLVIKDDQSRTFMFDCKPYMHGTGQPLNDLQEFNKVTAHGFYVKWPCGFDLSADTIESKLEPLPVYTGFISY